MPQVHPHFSTGEPCYCRWYRPSKHHLHKQAATWDEIRNFKKIRTNPAAQELVEELAKRGYGQEERQLKWIPWLLEQVRKGHVQYSPDGRGEWRTPFVYQTSAAGEGNTMTHDLTRQKWQHVTDWANSTHPTRQGVDMMNVPIQDVHRRVDQWDQDLQSRKRRLHADAGIPIHTYPDNWTLRELGPHELANEGDIMGHCVGGYKDDVANGNLRVLSLRDHKGEPHVTTGIYHRQGLASPWVEDDNGGYQYDPTASKQTDPGYIYQHQGKGNATPKPEYDERYRQYFETMPVEERPLAEDYDGDSSINDIDELGELLQKAGPADPDVDHMGLPRTPINHAPDIDWERVHDSLVREPYYARDPHYDRDDGHTLWEGLQRWGDPHQYERDILQPSEQENLERMDDNYFNYGEGVYHSEYPQQMKYMDNGDDADWEEELEQQGLEDTPQTRAQYLSDHEDAEMEDRDAYYEQNPRYQANNHMYNMYNEWSQQQKPQQTVAKLGAQKRAERFHFHIHYHHPCHCPWGAGEEHVGHVKEAAKLDWLRGRKDMQDEEGQRMLTKLETFKYPDKMLPWIIREWRRGRLTEHERYPNHYLGWNEPHLPGHSWNWFTSEHANEFEKTLDEMKQHGQGVDMMQHTHPELAAKIKAFQQYLEGKRAPHFGEVYHKFDDDWTMRRIQNPEEATREGNQMGHCVGGYGNLIKNGERFLWSLRDHNNNPHATIEIHNPEFEHRKTGEVQGNLPEEWAKGDWKPIPHSGSEIGQFYGKEDSPPLDEYAERVNEWLHPHGLYAETFQPWWDDHYTAPGAETVREYLGGWDGSGDGPEPPDDYYSAVNDAEENGVEPPTLEYEPPDIGTIWNDHASYQPPQQERRWYHRPYHFEPDEAESLFDAAHDMGHLNEFVDAYHDWSADKYDPNDPDHRALNDWWKQRVVENTNPETGEWEDPVHRQMGYPHNNFSDRYETAQDRWWTQHQQNYPQLPGEQWQEPDQQQPLPEPMRQGLLAKKGRTTPPLYYRWVFSPDTGEVKVGHNDENHPAHVRYHKELAGELNRPNLVHGFAYRLLGGWRLTDWEHKPVDDPFIVAQVLQGLGEHVPVQNDEDSWVPAAHDYERTHYGLPQPKLEDSSQSL